MYVLYHFIYCSNTEVLNGSTMGFGALCLSFSDPKLVFLLTQNMVKIPIFHGQSQFFHIFSMLKSPQKNVGRQHLPHKPWSQPVLKDHFCTRPVRGPSLRPQSQGDGVLVILVYLHFLPTCRPDHRTRNGTETNRNTQARNECLPDDLFFASWKMLHSYWAVQKQYTGTIIFAFISQSKSKLNIWKQNASHDAPVPKTHVTERTAKTHGTYSNNTPRWRLI